MFDDVVNDPEFGGMASKERPGRGFRLEKFLMAVGIIGLLVALVTPSNNCNCNWSHVRRMQCANYLKQIALALRSYADDYGGLPPAYTVDEAGRRLHSWRTLVLPYLGQEELYKKIDLSKAWDDPVNSEALRTRVPCYHCPEVMGNWGKTTYLAVVGPGGCLRAKGPRRLEEITDDRALTLMVVEAGEGSAVPWMAPVDADEALVLGIGPETKLHHEGGVEVGFVDGHVGFLEADTPVGVRRAMMSIAGDDDEVVRKR